MRQLLVTLSPTLCAAVQNNIRRTLRTYKGMSHQYAQGEGEVVKAEEEEEDTALVSWKEGGSVVDRVPLLLGQFGIKRTAIN